MPLPPSVAATYRRAFKDTVNHLGVPCDYTSSKGEAPASFVVGFSSPQKNDENVVNAYGIEAKIVTVPVESLSLPPVKFNGFRVNHKKFIAQAVHDILINEVLIGWKVIVKGGR